MFEHPTKFDNAWSFSRFDTEHWLAPGSGHPIDLEDKTWLTAEHYYQANKYTTPKDIALIAAASSAKEAYQLGNRWFKFKRANFKALRPVLMTRALYTKACMYDELKQALLDSGDQLIVETSIYDHYWGIARDQRGENQLGKIWMDIRAKLREQASE